MKYRKLLLATVVFCSCNFALASGFSLYEPSGISTAMGGALLGKAMDASANFVNPATLTDLTNIIVTVGFVTEHPRGRLTGTCNGTPFPGREIKMDPGFFTLPHLQLAAPLPYDFAFGIGLEPEFGLGTEFGKSSPLAWNARETTVQSFTFNPNLAYKITDKWSIGIGVRWMYFDFEQYKNNMQIANIGTLNYHLKGDNHCHSVGWQIGTKYDITENFAVGIVYKSPIDVTVRGNTDADSTSPTLNGMGVPQSRTGPADADLTLPQSVTAGFNWDITDDWHLGMSLSWTQWSEFDKLVFNVPPQPMPIGLDWRDTWRTSCGVAWDFAEDWTWMVSYVYDMDCTSGHQESAMLPPASRHITSTGITWRCWGGLEFTLCYSCIFMNGHNMHCKDMRGNIGYPPDIYDLKVSRGFCHSGGFSITYRF